MRFLKLLQVPAAAGLLWGLFLLLVDQLTAPADRFYQFINERGFVQYAILFVACLVAVLLYDRVCQLRWNRKQFLGLEQGGGQPPRELARQLKVVSRTFSEHSPSAAAARAEQAAGDYHQQIRMVYEAISTLAGALPALGMFGTMLGMSNSLFYAFSGSVQGSERVQVFVTALATAIDTTVLGMACAVPLFGCIWLLGRRENELGGRYATYVRDKFQLEGVAAGDKTVQALRPELRRLTAKIALEAKAAFEQILKDSAAACRENLERIVGDVLATQRDHHQNLVKSVAAEVAAGLRQSVDRVGDFLQRQNGRLAENMILHVGQLEKALRNRSPEEILIRYQHNGHSAKE